MQIFSPTLAHLALNGTISFLGWQIGQWGGKLVMWEARLRGRRSRQLEVSYVDSWVVKVTISFVRDMRTWPHVLHQWNRPRIWIWWSSHIGMGMLFSDVWPSNRVVARIECKILEISMLSIFHLGKTLREEGHLWDQQCDWGSKLDARNYDTNFSNSTILENLMSVELYDKKL